MIRTEVEKGRSFYQSKSFLNKTFLFSLRGVGVCFGELTALDNIQLDIKKGEILFVTGPSGAGKTTLLKILAGHLRPTTGSFKNHATGLFISQVFQDLRLIMDMSIKENLLLSYDKKLYSNKQTFLFDLHELSRALDFEDKLDMKMTCANGGLKQKTAVVRALLSRPNVFIADEPTGQLDFKSAQNIFEVFNLYNIKRNMTIIWASHNQELVKRFATKVFHLKKGKLMYSGHACFI